MTEAPHETAALPVTPRHPHCQNDGSKIQKEKASNKGFEHFLSLLNKGVDMDLLNMVANDDNKEAPHERAALPVTPRHHHGQSDSSKIQKEKTGNKGFEHFLKILNKGIDMELLNTVANDDGKEAPHHEMTALPVTPPHCSQSNISKLQKGIVGSKGVEHFTGFLNKGVDKDSRGTVANDDSKEASHHKMAAPRVTPVLHHQSHSSKLKKENVGNKGFEHFLDLLNKGVDMDLLNTVVNDDIKEVPHQEITAPPVIPPHHGQDKCSKMNEKNVGNKGFECFLSLLNKGVDMDQLNRIVNDDSRDLHSEDQPFRSSKHSGVRGESDLATRSKSPQCNIEAQLSANVKARTEPSICEQFPRRSRTLTGKDQNGKGKLDYSPDSKSRSDSPPLVEKTKIEEENMVDVNEQHQQLKNIVNTLGLDLEMEDLNRLTDRTQERLYGKKNESRPAATSRTEQENAVITDSSCKPDGKSPHSSPSSSRSCSRSHSCREPSHSIETRDHCKKESLSRGSCSSKTERKSPSPSLPSSSRSSNRSRSHRHPSHSKESQDFYKNQSLSKGAGSSNPDTKSPSSSSSSSRSCSSSPSYRKPPHKNISQDLYKVESLFKDGGLRKSLEKYSSLLTGYDDKQAHSHSHPPNLPSFSDDCLSDYRYYSFHNNYINSYWPTTPPSSTTLADLIYSSDSPDGILAEKQNCRQLTNVVVKDPDLSTRKGRSGSAPSSKRQKRQLRQMTNNISLTKEDGRMDVEQSEEVQTKKLKQLDEANQEKKGLLEEVPIGAEQTKDILKVGLQHSQPKQLPTEEEIRINLRKKLEAFNKLSKKKSFNLPNPYPDTKIFDD
ncbi:uncharacterized protein LOC130920264 isoform X2 [Corythoichthys intestinalis]|nr:uncharacterized protein LOC130920264 isoform X2 [Corythoichthys intestinalis]